MKDVERKLQFAEAEQVKTAAQLQKLKSLHQQASEASASSAVAAALRITELEQQLEQAENMCRQNNMQQGAVAEKLVVSQATTVAAASRQQVAPMHARARSPRGVRSPRQKRRGKSSRCSLSPRPLSIQCSTPPLAAQGVLLVSARVRLA